MTSSSPLRSNCTTTSKELRIGSDTLVYEIHETSLSNKDPNRKAIELITEFDGSHVDLSKKSKCHLHQFCIKLVACMGAPF